jgi:hypothetical protein
MKIVKNRVGNACFLACIESFLDDNDIKLTQEEMIKKLRPPNQLSEFCSFDGIVEDLVEVCDKLGVKFENIKYQFPVDLKYRDGSLLITLHGEQRHCVRFFEPLENNKFGIMDPNFNMDNDKEEFAIQDENYLIHNKCQFHKISLKPK